MYHIHEAVVLRRNSRSDGEEILRVLQKPKVLAAFAIAIQNSVLSQINPVHVRYPLSLTVVSMLFPMYA
jgi:hypothetical protein